MKILFKPYTADDADIFTVDAIHKKYWKDFCDVCYPRFGFESKEDGERTYEQKYETFRQCHVFAMQQFEWNEAMMFKVHEQDLQRFQEAYEFFTNLSNDDNAAIPMLTVLLRIQQSIWNRLREDRQMMEYIYPRNCNISCEKYKVDFVANSPEDEHVVKDMGDLEKSILDKLYFERDWDFGWQQDISNAMVHQIGYYNDEKIEWDETAGSLTQRLAGTIIDSYNYSLSTFESEYEHLVTARHGSVIHAIVYRLFMSYQTSLDEIKSIIEDYPAEICLVKLTDVRSELIEEFKKNKLGKHWYECVKSKNGLEKVGRYLINHRNTISEEEEEHFFYLLDEICIITDILKGNAAKYWLNVEYEHMAESPEAPIAVQEEIVMSEQSALLPSSSLDSIFHKALNLAKVKKAIQDIIIMKGEEGKFRLSVKQTFILHKVLEEIDWLDDDTDTTFIQWYDDVYKWPWKTRNFKAVLSPFKNTPSASWNENTVKDANTGREYRDFANYVRNLFVEIDANGKITDKQEFLKLGSDGKPMYIGHDLRGNL